MLNCSLLNKTENLFVSKISENLHLDSTRENFARETFRTLNKLTKGLLKQHTGYQRLLLGRKGVGKTTLAEGMQKVAKVIFGGDLITIYYEYSMNNNQLPSSLISEKLNLDSNVKIKSCEKILQEKENFIFLVLDEIQNLYLKNENGISVIDEIFEIGCSRTSNIFCIITGSSYHLRQLCFAKLSNNLKEDYPNYLGQDLNSTKFSSRWIYPFLETNDFENILKLIYQSLQEDYNQVNQETQAKLYLKSGGNPRILKELVKGEKFNFNSDSYAVSMKHFSNDSDIKLKILEVVFQCTSVYVERALTCYLPNSILAFKPWTRLFCYKIFLDKIKQSEFDQCELLRSVYDLADSGHLRFIDDQVTGESISLASPLIYLQLANNGKNTITLDEAFALKNPYGDYADIAENLTLRILAQNAHVFQIPGLEIIDKDVEKIVFKESYTNLDDEMNACYDLDCITNIVFKETYVSLKNQCHKDALGIDGIIIEIDNRKEK